MFAVDAAQHRLQKFCLGGVDLLGGKVGIESRHVHVALSAPIGRQQCGVSLCAAFALPSSAELICLRIQDAR